MTLFNKLIFLVYIAIVTFGFGDLYGGRSDRDSDRPNLYYKNRYEPLTPYPPRYYPNWYGNEPEGYKYRERNSTVNESRMDSRIKYYRR